MRFLGIILIIAGAFALAYQGIPYKKREKLLDLGPIHATAEREETIPLPPWVGGGALAVGVLMVVLGGGGRRRR
jgi:hypothetical protein